VDRGLRHNGGRPTIIGSVMTSIISIDRRSDDHRRAAETDD
jgi:hypothetical protein